MTLALDKLPTPETDAPHEHKFVCTYEGWDGERYRCECGESYFLDYEDMK